MPHEPVNVVAVEAHPDDVELTCLGTLIKLADRGARITVVAITNGDKGGAATPDAPHESIAALRVREATRVTDALGGRFVSLGAPDAYLYDTPELRNAMVDVLREAAADVVLAPPPADYQNDHTIASAIVYQATQMASSPTVPVARRHMERSPRLYWCDSILTTDFAPSLFVDIGDVIERKRQLAALHESQMAHMQLTGGWTLTEQIEVVGRYRGLQSGVQYAEGFQVCWSFPRGHAFADLPLG